MGKVMVAISVNEGKIQMKIQNEKATPQEISLTMSTIEVVREKLHEIFKKFALENQKRNIK